MRQQKPSPALKHSLGQNFILDEAVQAELADFTGVTEQDNVLEIGAGSGMLTKQLALRCGRVIAVELDRDMIPWLKAAVLSCPNAEIVQGDILSFLQELFPKSCMLADFRVFASYLYHVSINMQFTD